jgi:hypothetical protein
MPNPWSPVCLTILILLQETIAWYENDGQEILTKRVIDATR